MFTTSIAVKFVALLLEMKEKREILRPKYKSYPPEATSSIFNKFFFWWQIALFRKGFSTSLTVDDLFVLDKHLAAEHLQDLLQSAWQKGDSLLHSMGHSLPLPGTNYDRDCSYRQRSTLALFLDLEDAQMAHLLGDFSEAVPHGF